jgi:hypothetical protein
MRATLLVLLVEEEWDADADGVADSRTLYTHDERGNLVEATDFGDDGTIDRRWPAQIRPSASAWATRGSRSARVCHDSTAARRSASSASTRKNGSRRRSGPSR